MSEGIFFYSNQPNITLYLPGHVIRFKNGRFPGRKGVFATEAEIEAIKAHDSYPGVVESNVDRQERLTPDPKVEADLVEQALARLSSIPGVVPSGPSPSPPPSDPQEKSQELELEQSEQAPSLTEVNKMKKADLISFAKSVNLEVTETDTAAILKRMVRSWVRQNTV